MLYYAIELFVITVSSGWQFFFYFVRCFVFYSEYLLARYILNLIKIISKIWLQIFKLCIICLECKRAPFTSGQKISYTLKKKTKGQLIEPLQIREQIQKMACRLTLMTINGWILSYYHYMAHIETPIYELIAYVFSCSKHYSLNLHSRFKYQ